MAGARWGPSDRKATSYLQKRGMYQHCAEKHLHRYRAEFDFRYNNRSKLGVEDFERVQDRERRGRKEAYLLTA